MLAGRRINLRLAALAVVMSGHGGKRSGSGASSKAVRLAKDGAQGAPSIMSMFRPGASSSTSDATQQRPQEPQAAAAAESQAARRPRRTYRNRAWKHPPRAQGSLRRHLMTFKFLERERGKSVTLQVEQRQFRSMLKMTLPSRAAPSQLSISGRPCRNANLLPLQPSPCRSASLLPPPRPRPC